MSKFASIVPELNQEKKSGDWALYNMSQNRLTIRLICLTFSYRNQQSPGFHSFLWIFFFVSFEDTVSLLEIV